GQARVGIDLDRLLVVGDGGVERAGRGVDAAAQGIRERGGGGKGRRQREGVGEVGAGLDEVALQVVGAPARGRKKSLLRTQANGVTVVGDGALELALVELDERAIGMKVLRVRRITRDRLAINADLLVPVGKGALALA